MKRVSFISALFKSKKIIFTFVFLLGIGIGVFETYSEEGWQGWMNFYWSLFLIPLFMAFRMFSLFRNGDQVIGTYTGIRASYDGLSSYYVEFDYEGRKREVLLDDYTDDEFEGKRCELVVDSTNPTDVICC